MILFDKHDPEKAKKNRKNHEGVTFEEGETVLYDNDALTILDNESDPTEARSHNRHERAWPNSRCRLHLSRRANQDHLRAQSGPKRTGGIQQNMKSHYDFSKGKRGAVLPEPPLEPGKVKISIRLDEDIVQRFFEMADESGGETGYQTLINAALREYLDGKAPKIEDTLRRIVREEIARAKKVA
jgi:uncharacterized protein (DUF4415 family)